MSQTDTRELSVLNLFILAADWRFHSLVGHDSPVSIFSRSFSSKEGFCLPCSRFEPYNFFNRDETRTFLLKSNPKIETIRSPLIVILDGCFLKNSIIPLERAGKLRGKLNSVEGSLRAVSVNGSSSFLDGSSGSVANVDCIPLSFFKHFSKSSNGNKIYFPNRSISIPAHFILLQILHKRC